MRLLCHFWLPRPSHFPREPHPIEAASHRVVQTETPNQSHEADPRMTIPANPTPNQPGHLPLPENLVNIPRLLTAYYTLHPDPSIPAQRVAFGTSGHRGSAF